MRPSTATLITAVLVVAMVVLSNWAWFAIPGGLPVNYLGLDGHRHIGTSREAFLIVPLVAGAVAVGLAFAANRSRSVQRAPELFDAIRIGVMGVLLTTEAALVERALDPQFNVLRPTAIATGVLLLAVGNYLGKARQNSVVGIRTPWTLADARVWDKTHRFTGRAMVAGGLVLIALGFVLSKAEPLGAAIAVCAAVPLIVGLIRSRGYARARPRG